MIDILDEVHEKFGGHLYGRYVAIRCPFHDDSSPSLLVYENGYRCEACGARGSSKKLLNLNNTMLPAPALEEPVFFQNPFTKWSYKYDLKTTLKLAWERNIENPSYYLEKRGIPPKWQLRFGIGMLDDWLTLPIYDRDGKIVGATARAGEDNNSPAKYTNPKGQDPNLLYIPRWDILVTKLYLTFGILDAVTLAMLNIPAASTTTGKRLNPSSLDWFRGEIFVVPDNGEELDGYKLVSKLGLRAKLHVPDYTEDKDINGLWQKRKIPVKDWIRNVLRMKGD